ncbi:hypothetical protein JKY72_04560 [Candidatus Gracilibacteria bacterium]|nr:hypothetical protein [Candidatus Gracilibacteria bacterium]
MAALPENSPNSALLQLKDLMKTEQISYGNSEKEKADIILICPHDGDHKAFLNMFVQLRDQWPEDISVEDYMNLERDIGSEMITDALLEKLLSKRSDLRIDVIKIKEIPRGVLDVNRKPASDMNGEEFAVRKCFEHQKFPKLYEIFQEIHLAVVTEIREAIADLADGGLFIDIHTMNDHCPTDPVELSATNIKEYCESLTVENKKQRSVNALTTTPDDKFLANQTLAQELKKAFTDAGYTFEYDDPYDLIPRTMTTDLLERNKGKGIGIDYPLYVLHDGNSNNISPEIIPEKVEKVAALTATAILASLN